MQTELGKDLAGALSVAKMKEIEEWCRTAQKMLNGFSDSARSDAEAHKLKVDAIAFHDLAWSISRVTA